jgi:TonB-dependent receptor
MFSVCKQMFWNFANEIRTATKNTALKRSEKFKNKSMKQSVHKAFIIIVLSHFSILSWAQSGNVKGIITGSGSELLPGVVIKIEQTGIKAVTGMDGSFELLKVPAGQQKMTLSYMGYQTETRDVLIEEKQTVHLGKIRLTETEQVFNEVVVTGGIRKGSEAKAINMMKMSNKVITVLSAEGIAKLPDRNAADALQRVAGVAVQKNKGEGNYVSIRGTPTDWTATLLNGDRLPVADEENTSRSFDFEIIPSSLLDYLIVTRSVTPDMEADNIGGAVNIITQSSVTEKTFRLDAGGGFNTLVQKPIGNINFVWGDISRNKKFSFIADGSYYVRNYAADAALVAYGTPYNHSLARLELKDYTGLRTTRGLNFGSDYKFNDRFKMGTRLIYSQMLDDKYQQKMSYNWNDGSGARIRLQNIHGLLDRQMYGAELNSEWKVNDKLKIDAKVASYDNQFSYGSVPYKGKDNRNGYYTAEFISPLLEYTDMIQTDFSGQKLSPDAATSYPYKLLGIDNPYGTGGDHYKNIQPKYTQMLDPLSPDNDLSKPVAAGQYYLSGAFADLNTTKERDPIVAQLNGHYKMGNKVTLSAGGKYRMKEGERNISIYQWTLAPGVSKIPLTDFETTSMNRADRFLSAWGTPYKGTLMPAFTQNQLSNFPAQYADSLVGQAMDTNNSEFRNWVGSHYKYKETVAAAYIMAEANIGSKLSLVGGLRIEHTALHETSDTLVPNNDPASIIGISAVRASVDRKYIAVLPALNATYALSPSENLRAAVSRTFHRPNFEETKPGSALFERENFFFIQGNPNLKPTFSINADLMFEHYWGNKGMWSLGGYYKHITDHIFEAASPRNDPAYAGYVQKTFINAKKAYVVGVEAVLNRNFDFLPGFFKRFGINANITWSQSQMDVPGRPKQQAMTEQSPLLYNVSLYYEHRKINTRLGFNYTAAYSHALNLFTDVTTNELVHQDTDYDYYAGNSYSLDYQFLYRFNEHFSMYAEVNNILNAPYHTYVGRSDRPGRTEFYSQRVMLGVKFKL